MHDILIHQQNFMDSLEPWIHTLTDENPKHVILQAWTNNVTWESVESANSLNKPGSRDWC